MYLVLPAMAKKQNTGKKLSDRLGYIPDSILINVPNAFFLHEGKITGDREAAFRRFYEAMGTAELSSDAAFYHFMGAIPTIEIQHIFVCFKGLVQYKAILVEFLRNQPVMLHDYQHPEPRNWCVTTGPVIKAPFEITQKGFQGFRYTKELF